MKKRIIAALMAIGIALTGCSQGSSDAIAKVNGEDISSEEFKGEYATYRKMVYGQLSNKDMQEDAGNGQSYADMLGSQLADTMIMDKVMKDEFDKEKLEISQEEKDEAMNKLVEQSGGEEAFNDQLDAMGIKKEDMEKVIEKTMIQEKLRENYIEKNEKTDEEIKEFFEKNKESLVSYEVSHILVETEEEAKEIKAQLDKGEDFSKLAEEYSIDTGSAVNGGDLGEITMETNFVQPFLDQVKGMKAGEISDPVESEFGYHIIKVSDVKDSVEDHKDMIQERLLESEINNYFSKLYDDADVTIYKSNISKQVEAIISEEDTAETSEGEEIKAEETEENKEETSEEETEEETEEESKTE